MEFLSFFGLNEDPFRLTPDPAYFYPSSSHNEGLMLMNYSIDQKEGFVVIIGDPGTGKTTLLKVFLERWKERAETAIVLTPRLSPEEFLITVADDFGIHPEGRNKNEIIRALRDFMARKSEEGKRVVIIVDEAQNLPYETLEELRLLSNLETDKDKLLQIILLGQPELEDKLRMKELRQLDQRITTRIHLRHFNEDETLDYINFRLIKAGRENLHIQNRAGRLVFKMTRGVPRLINMLISRALMAAYLEESTLITPAHVKNAAKSLDHSEMKVRSFRLMPVPAAAMAAVIVAVPLYFGIQGLRPAQPDSVEASQQNKSPVKIVSVNVDVAVVRSEPSLHSRKIGWALKGNQLVVLNESVDERNVRWYQIPFEGEKRWISEEVVDIMEVGVRS
jgi:general secretion pathway protein A